MNNVYPFESTIVRNRLGQGTNLLVHPFSITKEHVCTLVALPANMHSSIFKKNAEHIVYQLRERFSRKVKKFSVVELRDKETDTECWYGWKFHWVGNTPLESQCYPLSDQQKQYYQKMIAGCGQASKAG